jgi:predicted nucleotidyltransferase
MAAIRNKHDVFHILLKNQTRLRSLGVSRLGLFGSFVQGEQNPDSDIDLLVEFCPGEKTFDAFMHLSFLLEELLEHPVELVTVESLSPYLGPHILKEVEFAAIAA